MSTEARPEMSSGLSPAQLAALRPYVVDLQDGKFSTTAELNTTPADVDAIFATHLPAFIQARGGGPVTVLFWAHGGLVSEGSALATANQHVQWWLANGIYPIFFIWHTGLWSTVGDLIADHIAMANAERPAAAPAFKLSDITDAGIELAARALGGPALWSAMKTNAQRSSGTGGGAAYVAAGVQSYVVANPGAITLHAAGHSAGAIFHAYFVPNVIKPGVVEFDTCSLLAPAIRSDFFEATLAPHIGAGIKAAALFSMTEANERADNCLGVYRKSLLYLIRGALEVPRNTNILGLQECIKSDEVLSRLFPTAPGGDDAEAIWSVTSTGPLNARSAALHHGDFDGDTPTMDSVARRIAATDNIISFALAGNAAVLAAAAALPNP